MKKLEQSQQSAGGPWKALADYCTPWLASLALRGIGLSCRLRPSLRGGLKGQHPSGVPFHFDASFHFTTRDSRSQSWARFSQGKMTAGSGPPAEEADVKVIFRDESYQRRFFSPSGGADLFGWMLDQHLTFDGNLVALAKFGLIAASVTQGGKPLKRPADRPWPGDGGGSWEEMKVRRPGEPCPDPEAAGATWLRDPGLSRLTLDHFPRLKRQLHQHLHHRPRICTERARLYTEGTLKERENKDPPVLQQARIFDHVLRHKQAIVHQDDLLLGTTTSHLIGVQIFPELGGTAIWPELLSIEARELNPYLIAPEDIRVLDQEVFPFWINDNIREWTRRRFGNPKSLRLDERWVLYFQWKNHAISHTIADMPAVLSRGLKHIVQEAREQQEAAEDPQQRAFFEGAALCLDAVMDYAGRLAREAEAAAPEADCAERQQELLELAAICRRVPAGPAQTLHEALNAVWICFLALHQENMNAGLSIGRLDTWLQPYLDHDLARAGEGQVEQAIERALEMVGAFMLKATDHLPAVADLGNRLFGGSSSDQVITVGGLRPDGSSAVCDMSYLILKATEMLGLRDPNMNARYSPGINPEYYLRRLCEVNLITGATPSLHNDEAVLAALEGQGIPPQDARDWGATGCVEPTICGQHMGHTGCIMFNMVAPLEMALNDGVHPVVGQQVGPRTGDPRGFTSYESFWAAYKKQLAELLDHAVEANNMLGQAHQALHPTPFLSSLIQGTFEEGKDVVDGGARYNSTGMAMVGLTDVVDSLSAIKVLVFEEQRWEMGNLMEALDKDFEGHQALRAEILNRVPRFGSGDPVPSGIANALMRFIFDKLQQHENYRGGRYVPGYWSMSNHVAFGMLSGALPSGRRRGKAFTPGLTPSPISDLSLLDQIRQVGGLDARLMPNNLAFNIKLAPGGSDTDRQVVDRMLAYAKSYFSLGGMQLQFNAVSSETMRQAMEQPEAHRDLLVRISGYNAYFVDLNRDMQMELIERTEHR